MADYAKFAIASEKALGLKAGKFLEVFDTSRETARAVVIEASPLAEAIVKLVDATPLVWKGTASQLFCPNSAFPPKRKIQHAMCL